MTSIRLLSLSCWLLVPLLLAPAARAEVLYKCTGEKGEVSIQSEPCPKGMTQVWKRDATPDPSPGPEELAARAALAEAEALRAAEAARAAEEARRVEQAQAEEQARLRAAEAAGQVPVRKSDCTIAHDFQDAALALDWLDLTQSQRERIRSWVIAQCRDPDAPVADEPLVSAAG